MDGEAAGGGEVAGSGAAGDAEGGGRRSMRWRGGEAAGLATEWVGRARDGLRWAQREVVMAGTGGGP